MALGYVLWALIAMVSYSFVFLFAKLAMGDGSISPFTVMTIAVVLVAVIAAFVTAATGRWAIESYTSQQAWFSYAAGIALTLAVIGYFKALSTGPASIVVPIYGMFIVGGSVLGILFLEEPLTAKKLLGIGFASLSVVLIAS